jgi:hypothetical protein
MSGDTQELGTPPASQASSTTPVALNSRQWRQIAGITLAAAALYAGFRALPVGSDLNHIDFKTGSSPGSLEMCDPSNPQFIPVVAVRSPVSMTVTPAAAGASWGDKQQAATAGAEVRCVVRLLTASGKPIGPQDLQLAHTRKLHLLIVDPTLTDYQHVHPEPGEHSGEWGFAFTPARSGLYRIFADFTPTATGRGLYASADLEVEPSSAAPAHASPGGPVGHAPAGSGAVEGHVFSLRSTDGNWRAGKQAELIFTVKRTDGGEVAMLPVMDAYAHLVAFDEARSGFAHLHPNEADLSHAPETREPRLTFKITIPRAGSYVIWAQVNLGGVETFVPFRVEVT